MGETGVVSRLATLVFSNFHCLSVSLSHCLIVSLPHCVSVSAVNPLLELVCGPRLFLPPVQTERNI
jgi:hypothetical protein